MMGLAWADCTCKAHHCHCQNGVVLTHPHDPKCRIARFLREIDQHAEVAQKLIDERDRVLDAIPPCPVHGHRCVPHALDWVKMARPVVEAAELRDAVDAHHRAGSHGEQDVSR